MSAEMSADVSNRLVGRFDGAGCHQLVIGLIGGEVNVGSAPARE
jgi:hypothetical protein